MKKTSILIAVSACSTLCLAGPVDLLVKRQIPGQEKHFQFVLEHAKGQRSFFEVDANKQRIRIKGDTPVSIACGLNWYLNEYTHTNWTDTDSRKQVLETFPLPQDRTRHETYIQLGFSNYDANRRWYWSWTDWEKEIDCMALSGVNVYPVWIGCEPAWNDFLSAQGLSETQINQYLYGTDDVPDWWKKHLENLHKKIIRRLSELGIAPVYPVFTGRIPLQVIAGKPNVSVCTPLSAESMRRKETVISADDPLFASMGRQWYQSFQRTYGSVPIYYGSTDGQPFAADIQKCLLQNRPDALWIAPADDYVQQRWSTQSLKQNKVILTFEQQIPENGWKEILALKSVPWIWTLSNHTDCTTARVSLSKIIHQPAIISNYPETASLIQGVGTTTNCSGENPFVFTLVHQRRWQPEVYDLKEEVDKYLKTNYGQSDTLLMSTWMKLAALTANYNPTVSFVCQRPSMQLLETSTADSTHEANRMQQTEEAVQQMLLLQDKLGQHTLFRKELTYYTALLIEQKSRLAYRQIISDLAARRLDSMTVNQEIFLRLIMLADKLRQNHPALDWHAQQKQADLLFGKYHSDAAMWYRTLLRHEEEIRGSVPALSGLLAEYCVPRWQLFFAWMNQTAHGRHISMPQYEGMENEWYTSGKNPDAPHPDTTQGLSTLCQIVKEATFLKTKCN